MKRKSILYLVAGANGAGKTTSSFEVLPEILKCKEYINADAIANALSPFNPESVSLEAGKILLKRIDKLISEKSDFAFETTLASRSIMNIIKKARASEYKIIILFFYLNSYRIAINRVRSRVITGGHNIPNDVIKRRYFRGVYNLMYFYKNECDYCLIVNNSGTKPELIAELKNNSTQILNIYSETEWKNLINYAKEKK
ncbi:MAG: zeta toxin family protein [bacterium]